ncbi:MAG: helix-turn-helix domain-containing protein [Nigerium sp.]|nr:helix-turn-helix domain-containing protein [Nigerium sp.]
MKTIETSAVPADQSETLAQLANTPISPELRDVLLSVSRCIREGVDLVIVDDAATFTPTQVATRLGMSRTHLYKLLDRGEIVSHRVGRDRRIRVTDLLEFEQRRQQDRRELAERFAKQTQTGNAAIDEIADLL